MTQQEPPIPPGNALARPRPRTGGRIAALAAALWLCMLPSRAMIMGYITPDDLQPPELHQIPELILIGVYDFAFVFAMTLLMLLSLRVLGRWKFARCLIFRGFVVAAIVCLLWSRINVSLVSMLGRPLNYQWLYYSDFLQSFDAQQAIRDGLADKVAGLPRELWYWIVLLGAMSALTLLILSIARGGARWIKGREGAFAIIPLGFAHIFFGNWYLSKYQWPRV